METLKRIVCIVALFASLSGFAAKVTVNGITWTLGWFDEHCTNVGGGTSSSTAVPTSTTGDITIPSTFGVYSVTGIGDYAFYNCNGLTSVTIPYSVTSIGSYAFFGCNGLTGVNIPSSVTSIGSSAFYNCTNLTSATIPNKVTSIGNKVFYGCSGLTSVVIGNWVVSIPPYAFYGCSGLMSVILGSGVTSIESCAFYNCTNLTSLTIPNRVTSIGEWAFSGCSGLTSVTIPASVTSIGSFAFSGCSGLTSATIPQCVCGRRLSSVFSAAYQSITNVVISAGVTSIGSYAFDGCRGLTSVTIPSSVTNIGSYAFADCSGLTSVTIPSRVTSIGSSAFSGCSGLTSVTIPDSVTSIGSFAFYGCSGLTSVTIPNNVTNIGSSAFRDCCGLMSISVAPGNAKYSSMNSLLLTKDGTTLIQGVNGDVTIPDGVTSIGDYAFYGCSGLTSVIIPDGVTSIGDRAFSGCSGLTSVTIPSSVTNIGSYAFADCSNLYDTNSIPGVKLVDGWAVGYTSLLSGDLDLTGVRGIGSSVFPTCEGLTSVTIPDSVTSIGSHAFYYCTNLTSVTIPASVTSIGSAAFSGCRGLRDVSIPQCICSSSLLTVFPSAYQSITNVVISDGVTSIRDRAFYGCSGLTSVTIPASVTSIEYSAFYDCSNLYDTNSIPSVKLVDGWAIGYTSLLSGNLDLTGVRGIGDRAFSSCSGLTSVTIPDGVTSIGSSAFRGCSGLTSVTMPESVTSIGSFAFSGCSGLTNVTIPAAVTSIGDQAFYNCRALTSVTIPASVTRIETCAFSGCSRLATAYVPNECSVVDDSFPFTTIVYRYSPVQDVALDMAGGTADVYSISVKYGDCYGALPTPIRSGYSFSGWKYGGLDIDEDTIVIALEDHTLVAQWAPNKYTIVFDANGGSGGTSNECDYGVAIIEPTVTRPGYKFIGWSPSVAANVPIGGATYTAQWEINQYVVTFDAAGGVGGTSSNQNYGTEIVVPTVTRTGYTFIGWWPEVSTTVPAGDVTYVAQWTANQYVVVFDANGGDGGVTNVQDYASEIVAPTVSREGYTFVGWSPEMPATVPASNITHTAQWAINKYVVTFDAAGGVGGTSSNQNYGTAIVVPTVTRTGYTFIGWSPEVSATVPADDVTYTAQWQINRYVVTLEANGGTCETEELNIEYCSTIGELPMPTREKAVFLGWFTEADGGDEVTAGFIVREGTTIYAHWLTSVDNPVISTDCGLSFRMDSCEVSISCETEDAVIYYSPKGATPRLTDAFRYTGPFTITDTATIKAIAVYSDGETTLKSDYVTATITKRTLTLAEAAGTTDLQFETGGDADWTPTIDATATSGLSAQSGVIGDDAETWLETSVTGAGTFAFRWKVDCEWDDSGDATWDRVVVSTNGVEAARMDGTSEWAPMSFSFADAGMHTIRWTFLKDDYDDEGAVYADFAWISGVTWTPGGVAPSDLIPPVAADAAPAAVTNAIEAAGFADEAGVKAAIGGSAAEYAAFKAWAGSVKVPVGSDGEGAVATQAGEAAVVANINAAAAYLLGAERLFANAPKVEFEEVVVAKRSSGTLDPTMTVTITVKDGEEIVACDAAKVASMFEATSDLGDWDGVAKLVLTVEQLESADGAMRFKVTPGDGNSSKAFLRIRR